MNERQEDSKGEIPLSWFGKTLWKFTPQYAELVFLAICLRLIGLVEPFIFQVIIDRILPFQREASLIVVMAIFVAASLFQLGLALLRNSRLRDESPFPLRDQATRTISAVPSAEKRFMRATRIWISAV
ncbi:MAG: hypothetical protein ACK446_04945, partial [Rhodobacterales bacterium]